MNIFRKIGRGFKKALPAVDLAAAITPFSADDQILALIRAIRKPQDSTSISSLGANDMDKFLKYFLFGSLTLGASTSLIAMIKTKTVTGAALYASIMPAISSLDDILTQVNIPADAVRECCEAVAAVINARLTEAK